MTVTGTTQKPDYDLTLTDGSSTLGFIVSDLNGNPDPTRFVGRPQDRSAVQTTIGESGFSDRVLPYRDVVQEDWSGGGGMRDFDKDKSRYYTSSNVDTSRANRITLSGLAENSKTFSSGYGIPFEYRRCLYAVNIIDGANSILWRNGYRGAADSNSGALSTLVDATQNWTTNALAGGTVILIAGPGSEETQPWRVIASNDATSITVTPSWNVTHTTATSYVIIGTNLWTQVLDLGGHVTDFVVADDFIYFARGETASLKVLRYNEYNLAGVWTERNSAETMAATLLMAIRSEGENVTYLYGGMNANPPYNTTVWKMRVPPTWEALYKDLGEVAPTNVPWSDRIITNVTNTTNDGTTKIDIAAGFTTGVAAVKDLATPVDITSANAIGFLIKSSVATNSGDLKLLMEDQADLGRQYYTPQAVYVVDPDQMPDYRAIPAAKDGENSTKEIIIPGYYIYIGDIEPFSVIAVDIATANTVTNTISMQYYNGNWTSCASVIDGTISSSKSFAQDGNITHIKQDDWMPWEIQGYAYYWLRISWSASVSSGTEVNQIRVSNYSTAQEYSPLSVIMNQSTGSYTEFPNTYDGDLATYGGPSSEAFTFDNASDYMYVGFNEKFNSIRADIQGSDGSASQKSVFYWNGTWTELTVTLTNGKSYLFEDDATYGSWTMPADWRRQIIDGTGYGYSDAIYWIRISDDNYAGGGDFTATDIYVSSSVDIGTRDPDGLYIVDLSSLPQYYDPILLYDGDAGTYESMWLRTDQYLYVGASMMFNKLYVDVKTANATASVLTAEYFNGSLWTSISITDGTISSGCTFGKDGEISWSPQNDWHASSVNGKECYWMRFDASVNFAAEVYEIYYARNNNITLTIPALLANTWTWVNIAVTPTAYPIPDEAAIKSVGLYVNVDNGAQTVYLMDGIRMTYTYATTTEIKLPSSAKINKLGVYNGDETGGVANVWAFTEDGISEIQQDGSVVMLPIGELKELSTINTGKAWCTNGVYLFFGLTGSRVERYYNKSIDDIGPNNDDGMTATRRGDISALLSMPGRIFAAVDAGGGTGMYSSIMMYKGSGWHTYYTSSVATARIRSLHYQEIYYEKYGYIWFSQGAVLRRIPYSVDPDALVEYESTGYVQMGRMYCDMRDVTKLFRSVKVFGSNLDANDYVVVKYAVDGAGSWTTLGTFDTTPSEEISFSAPYPTGKYIELYIELHGTGTSTPEVHAVVLNTYAIIPVKSEYNFTTILEDKWHMVNLTADAVKAFGTSSTSLAAYNIAKGWRDAATPLTMRHRNTLYDSLTVVINSIIPVPMDRPFPEQKNNMERYLVQFTLMDA